MAIDMHPRSEASLKFVLTLVDVTSQCKGQVAVEKLIRRFSMATPSVSCLLFQIVMYCE